MIIFGTRTYARLLATLSLVCATCHNPAAHHLAARVTKFTLFFIPLFPVSTKHLLTCTYCGTVSLVTKEQADRLVQTAPRAAFGPAVTR